MMRGNEKAACLYNLHTLNLNSQIDVLARIRLNESCDEVAFLYLRKPLW